MGRFTGPRAKICRRLGLLVFENTNVEKALLRRESVGFQRKKSEYGRRLQEKQKVMHYYGMRERQMGKAFDQARAIKGNTGEHFLVLCERRLDNVVFSAGFASSRAGARQLVNHGHVRVNGAKIDIASAMVSTGDTITFVDKVGPRKLVQDTLAAKSGYDAPDWIAVDAKSMTAKIVRFPVRQDVRLPVEEQLVVEFYSR
jgi:small subunit ribosomal protein S4